MKSGIHWIDASALYCIAIARWNGENVKANPATSAASLLRVTYRASRYIVQPARTKLEEDLGVVGAEPLTEPAEAEREEAVHRLDRVLGDLEPERRLELRDRTTDRPGRRRRRCSQSR